MARLLFHVRHVAKPVAVKEVLSLLDSNEDMSIDAMLELGRAHGYTIGTTLQSAQSVRENPVQTARDLGLIRSDRSVPTTRNFGKSLIESV